MGVLNYRVGGGDSAFENQEKCNKNSSKNSSYISKSIQNKLINCCDNYIKDMLFQEIKYIYIYISILADETTDCSNEEQLSLVIRLVDNSGEIREDFLGFLHCKLGLSGKALA